MKIVDSLSDYFNKYLPERVFNEGSSLIVAKAKASDEMLALLETSILADLDALCMLITDVRMVNEFMEYFCGPQFDDEAELRQVKVAKLSVRHQHLLALK